MGGQLSHLQKSPQTVQRMGTAKQQKPQEHTKFGKVGAASRGTSKRQCPGPLDQRGEELATNDKRNQGRTHASTLPTYSFWLCVLFLALRTLFGFAYYFWLCVLFLALRTIFDFLCCIQYGVPFHLCACVAGVQEGPVCGEFLQNNAVSELFEDR